MQFSIKQAAKFINVSRSTLYNKINSGELSKVPGGKLDMSELLRVFGHPDERDKTPKDEHLDTLEKTPSSTSSAEMDALKEQIRFLKEALYESKEREKWLMAKVDTLTDTVKLLEAPKTEGKKSFFSRLFG